MYSTWAEENRRRASPFSKVPRSKCDRSELFVVVDNPRIVSNLTNAELDPWLSRNTQGMVWVNDGIVS